MTESLHGHRHIHFVGIGGIGMSALARFLLARGYIVSGSDRSWNEQLDALQALGAEIREDHAAENVRDADLVVVTSAAAGDNVEVIGARERGIEVIKRAALLGAIANAGRCVAVAGTHGKTTTSALIGHILTGAGLDPTILIGGVSVNLGSNARVGSSDWVVVEADEYDRSFLHLKPSIAVLTNVEADHLDIYGTEDEVREAYRAFSRGVSNTLVTCADDPHMSSITGDVTAQILTYGVDAGSYRAVDIRLTGERDTEFSIHHDGQVTTTVRTSLAGLHNVRNALAALLAAKSCGISTEEAVEAIASFRGVERRFEVKGEAAGVLVMDDYAHHPTEIRTNLEALKTRYNRPVRVIFQPHTYSRTRSFLDDFARSFSQADSVYLMDIYAARETDTLGVSGPVLAEKTSHYHPQVMYTETVEELLDRLQRDVRPQDIVITMGAGDVNKVGPKLLERLACA